MSKSKQNLEQSVSNLSCTCPSNAETNFTKLQNLSADNKFSIIKVGWYAFAGGKFSPHPQAYPKLQGVVAWLNADTQALPGKRGLVLTPDCKTLCWGQQICTTGANSTDDGYSNTQAILAYGKKYDIKFPAAEWSAGYHRNGISPGIGFLPAKMQWLNIMPNAMVINQALSKIHGRQLSRELWSSSECSYSNAWYLQSPRSESYYAYKIYDYCARCVFAI